MTASTDSSFSQTNVLRDEEVPMDGDNAEEHVTTPEQGISIEEPEGVLQRDLPTLDTTVLVVGAGPTGLMAALVLHRAGVPMMIVDRKSGPTRESRALAVQARTMEIYDQLGLAQRVLEHATIATAMQIGDTGVDGATGAIELAQRNETRFPGIQIFEQSQNEQLLADSLTAAGVEPRWQHRLVDLTITGSGQEARTEALIDGPNSLTKVRATWVVGADGASSLVRRLLNVPFDGVTDDSTFWVADVRGVSGIPEGTMAMRFGAQTFGLTFPLGPGGHVRIVSLAQSDHIDQHDAIRTARTDLGLSVATVDWFSTYRVHHRVAAAFRRGPVFLAGDAAHVHSPVGGQGMNTGLQDAHNLALLLADVAHGRAGPEALDRYERERRPVAKILVNVTDRAFGVIGRRGFLLSALRRGFSYGAGRLAPRILNTKLGHRLGGYIGQYRIRYHFAGSVKPAPAWALDPVVGLRLPPIADNDEPLVHLAWALHTYGSEVTRPDLPDWIEGPYGFPEDPASRLSSGYAYLVRPDGFVAAAIPCESGVVDQLTLAAALDAHDLKT
jgi:2-polyprenyl-6-methoxyphenol hydroxylase-like FAD-dependent oxidoreductase